MKTKLKFIAIVSLIISLYSAKAESQKLFDRFDVYRVSSDFKGSIYDGKALLVYGTGGVILRSTDLGKQWEQINLDDRFNIIGMELIDGILFGLTNLNYLIKSENNGQSWRAFELEPYHRFKHLSSHNKRLICMTDTKIIIYSTNLAKIHEYNLQTDTNHYEFTISDNTLYYPAGKGKIRSINLSNHQERLIDMKSAGFCTDCELPRNLFSLGKSIYFNLDNRLYSYDGSKFKTALYALAYGKYCVNNNDIYQIYNVFNKSANLDSLYFIKANLETGFFHHIKIRENDRYITNLKINNVRFIDENTVIAVGANKLIYMSHDKGVNWKLVSVMPFLYNENVRFDNTNAGNITSYGKFYRTNNSGITWLPQRTYDSRYTQGGFQYVWGSSGLCFFYDKDNGYSWSTKLYSVKENMIYTRDNCETTNIKEMKFKYLTSEPLLHLNFENEMLLLLSGGYRYNRYTIFFILNLEPEEKSRSVLDSSHVKFIAKYKDNKLIGVAVKYSEPDTNQAVFFKNSYLYLFETDKNMTSFNEITKIDISIEKSYLDRYSIVDDDLFIMKAYDENQSKHLSILYRLNLSTLKLDTIYTYDTNYLYSFSNMTKINNTYYYSFYEWNKTDHLTYLIANEDFKNKPTEWYDVTPKERYSTVRINLYQNNLYQITAYDSLVGHGVVWFNKTDPGTSVAETNTETSDLPLYLSRPYPLPAREFVQVKLFWDKSQSIEKAIFTVSNLLGELVSSAHQFILNEINDYSAELIWRPPNLPPGIYFITIRVGQSTKTIPIVIS